MTRYPTQTVECSVCGGRCEQPVVESGDQTGAMDLDTRPSESLRSTIVAWMTACSHCGYCAENLAEETEGAVESIGHSEYRQQFTSEDYPELANRFLCRSLLDEWLGELADAGWSALYAAWACDDAGQVEAASLCRRRAADCFQAAGALEQPIADQPGGGDAILADAYRRSGQMAEAALACERGLEDAKDEIIRGVICFQQILIEQTDTGVYTMDQVQAGEQE